MNAPPIAAFRSIEAVDPTTLEVHPDRIELSGGGRASPRTVPLEIVTRVKVRTLLGVSTILIRTAGEGTVVADLFARSEANRARALIEELLAAPPADAPQESAPAA